MQQLKRSNWFRAIAAFLLMAFGVSPSLLSGQSEVVVAAMSATPPSCPVTKPNGKQPPIGENVFGRSPGGHGHDELWTNVWTWGEGVVLVPPTHVQPDGSLGGMKWPWWRGIPGDLTIAGHRLDADAPPLHADIPDGYGKTGFQVSGLIFPTTGCWQVTGRVAAASLTFVVQVKRVNATGTPIAEEQVEIAPSLAGKATPKTDDHQQTHPVQGFQRSRPDWRPARRLRPLSMANTTCGIVRADRPSRRSSDLSAHESQQ